MTEDRRSTEQHSTEARTPEQTIREATERIERIALSEPTNERDEALRESLAVLVDALADLREQYESLDGWYRGKLDSLGAARAELAERSAALERTNNSYLAAERENTRLREELAAAREALERAERGCLDLAAMTLAHYGDADNSKAGDLIPQNVWDRLFERGHLRVVRTHTDDAGTTSTREGQDWLYERFAALAAAPAAERATPQEPSPAEAPQALNADDLSIEGAADPLDTSVRITHKPTGLSAECCEHRSQIRNKEQALLDLAARVAAREQGRSEGAMG